MDRWKGLSVEEIHAIEDRIRDELDEVKVKQFSHCMGFGHDFHFHICRPGCTENQRLGFMFRQACMMAHNETMNAKLISRVCQ